MRCVSDSTQVQFKIPFIGYRCDRQANIALYGLELNFVKNDIRTDVRAEVICKFAWSAESAAVGSKCAIYVPLDDQERQRSAISAVVDAIPAGTSESHK